MYLVELEVTTYMVENFEEADNNEVLALEFDLLEERKDRALLRAIALRQEITRYYIHESRFGISSKTIWS